MACKIKNWTKFQHFKDRKPPWIKLYRDILDDIDWHELPGESAKNLIMFWLVASENDGVLPDIKCLAFRLRTTEKAINNTISTLSKWLEQDDITMISEGYQETRLETETETETDIRQPGPKTSGPTPADLMALWNKKAHPNLPRAKFLTEARKRHARARLTEHSDQKFWDDLIVLVNNSPLLRGDKGPWKASFDWVLNPQNLAKILEGNYSEKRSLNGTH